MELGRHGDGAFSRETEYLCHANLQCCDRVEVRESRTGVGDELVLSLDAPYVPQGKLTRAPACNGCCYFLAYQSALTGVKLCHFSGRSSRAKMAVTGQTGTQAPQSMHSVGLIYSCFSLSNCGSSLRGWMQSTGQTSTHAESFVPMHGSAIT